MSLDALKAFATRHPALVAWPLAMLLAAGIWLVAAAIIVLTFRAIGVLPS